MPSAKTHTRKPRARNLRLWKVGNARHALEDFDRGLETCCYTFGQFSLVDALAALLERTGPADIDIFVWTVGAADLQRVHQLTEATDSRHRLRWVVDQGFQSRSPEYLEQMRGIYGDEQIRTIRAHAKFITIGNTDWHIVLRTSMNLNQNTRFEHLDVTEDPDLYQWHRDLVDGIFARETAGDYGSKGLQDITGVQESKPTINCQMGIASTGQASTGKKPR